MSAQVSPTKSFFAGGFSGICLVTAGHPLDTIKVRLQTSTKVYNGTLDCIRKTFAAEGLGGFYRGMATPLAGITPIYATCFYGYSLGKKLQQPVGPDGTHSAMQIFKAGMLSSIFTLPLMGPGERIKCLLQVQNAQVTQYSGPIDCARQLYRTGGLRSIFRGTGATLLRDGPASGVYFMSYEAIRAWCREHGSRQLEATSALLAGGAAGVLFWVVALPFDVVKSRLQTSPDHVYPNGIRSVFQSILLHDGIAGFYRGASAVFLRAFPANAACFVGYEAGMTFLNWIAPG